MDTMPHFKTHKKIRTIPGELVDRSINWCFFDGASQREPTQVGAWGIIYSIYNVWINFTIELGNFKNNRDELLALKITLQMEFSKDIMRL